MATYRSLLNLGVEAFSMAKAIHRTTREAVAIKRLKWEYRSLEECMRLREVQSLIKLSLKHFIFEKNELFFAFKYMDNNLHRFIKYKDVNKPFSEAEVRRWMVEILETLEFMHKQGYIHMGLKPKNLLVSKDAIKVADLGLAREIQANISYTVELTHAGTRPRKCSSSSGCRIYTMVLWWTFGLLVPSWLSTSLSSSSSMGKNLLWDQGSYERYVAGWSVVGCVHGLAVPPIKLTLASLSEYLSKASPEAVDLIYALCGWNPSKRPTASEALQHPFFDKHHKQQRILPWPRLTPEGFHSNRATGVKHEVQAMGTKKFGRDNIALQQQALVV